MASPDTWTLDDARSRIERPAWLASHRAFAEGDHLHAGAGSSLAGMALGGLAGWIAPMPPADHALYKSYYDGVVRGFVSSNKVGEVIGRHKAGVVGRQPSKGFESKAPLAEGEQMPRDLLRLKQQADAWAAERWEAESMHTSLQGAVSNLLYAARQPARLLLPRGHLVKGKDGVWKLPSVDLPQMLQMIRLTYPKPEECTVYVDPDTFEEVGIFTYSKDGDYRAELTWVDRSTATQDKPGLTVVRVIDGAGNVEERRYDFGGLIPMYEMRRHPLVTPQMIQNQKALNLALSSVPRNVWAAGARARTAFNVDIPGKEVVDADGNKVFKEDPLDWGAPVINFLQGTPIIDEATGKVTGYANPSMQVEEPVDVTPSKTAVDIHAWEIHSEARQLHAITGTDSAASGLKLLVARVDYLSSLTETKPTVDGCIEWQMNTRLAMAEAFTGGREGGRATRTYSSVLRANAECKLDPGPITSEERAALDALVESGRLSEETALALMGVEDVAEEKARKAVENRVDNVLNLIERADSLGLDRYAVLTTLGGMKPEEARALARGDVTAGGLTQ
jgi:hypothetical protein